MSPDYDSDLERIAARIADDESVDWRLLARLQGRDGGGAGSGLRELSSLAQAFRAMNLQTRPPRERRDPAFRFAGLDVIEKIGEGAQGEVWRAYDPMLDQHVALKLRKVESGVLSHQFLEEGRRLARVRHANVVSVYGAATENGRAGLWMELIQGTSLKTVLREHGPLPPSDVVAIGMELCGALGAVHRHGLVHGDLKAENVLRDGGGRIVLTDFGAARDRNAAADAVVSGTYAYLAPELFEGAAATPASDIYALGVLLYHLLSGRFPVEAEDAVAQERALREGRRVPLRRVAPGVPRPLAALIERALSLDPAQRPTGSAEFATALAAALAPTTRRALGWAALALAAAGLVLGAIALWRTPPPPLAVEAGLYRLQGSRSTALSDGAPIALGDRLALKLDSERALYLYVFDDDGSGHAARLFPLAAQDNPVAAGTSRWLPGAGLSWQIDRAAAQEELLVLASTEPLAAVDRLVQAWPQPQAAEPTRGALTLAPTPATQEIQSAALREVLVQVQRDARVRTWHWRLPQAAAETTQH